jgi:hypothetical protein
MQVFVFLGASLFRAWKNKHPGESRDPGVRPAWLDCFLPRKIARETKYGAPPHPSWIPAFAGMTTMMEHQ